MSDRKTVEKLKNNKNGVDLLGKCREAIDNLKVQYQEHTKQEDHHKIMKIKSQGALEVLGQLLLEEENK